MQQLTAEDKARVFAQYLGCKYTDTTAEEPEVFPVIGETITCFERYPRAMATAQLILRPLSKISDEDKSEVCRLADNTIDTDHVLTEKDKKNLVKGMYDAMNEGEFPYHIADFLRSRSYMLPYKGIDLFEAGIAIEQPQK